MRGRDRGGMPPEPDLPPLNTAEHEVVVETRASCIEVRHRWNAPMATGQWLTLQLDKPAALELAKALGVAHDAHARGEATETTVLRGR